MASGIEAPAERRRDCIHPEPVTVAPAFDSTLYMLVCSNREYDSSYSLGERKSRVLKPGIILTLEAANDGYRINVVKRRELIERGLT